MNVSIISNILIKYYCSAYTLFYYTDIWAMLSGTISVMEHMEQHREEKGEGFGALGTEASDNPRKDLRWGWPLEKSEWSHKASHLWSTLVITEWQPLSEEEMTAIHLKSWVAQLPLYKGVSEEGTWWPILITHHSPFLTESGCLGLTPRIYHKLHAYLRD